MAAAALDAETCNPAVLAHAAAAHRKMLYHANRRVLIELGIVPNRGPGRPRLREPEEAAAVAREQKRSSQRRAREHIRAELSRLQSAFEQARSTDQPISV